MTNLITVSGIDVLIERKKIKNLHLGVYPPDGIVRVAAPENITDENIRLVVIKKLGWIKKQQSGFKKQKRQSAREMISGESHYYFGKRYLLKVVEKTGKVGVTLGHNQIILRVKPATPAEKKQAILNEWYRNELKKYLSELLAKWLPLTGVTINGWKIRRMKTKWGSCNTIAKNILFNSELAKKPPECIEYIVVHELVHLLERKHNQRFIMYMDKFFPKWIFFRDLLNSSPLAQENWEY